METAASFEARYAPSSHPTTYGGLARAISIAERIARSGDRRRPIRIVHETSVSAQIDGGDHLGYIVAHRATAIAVEKASAAGIAVGVNQSCVLTRRGAANLGGRCRWQRRASA